MAYLVVPAIDQNPYTNTWSEQDVNIYNSLPFYFAQEQYRKSKNWKIYSNWVEERPWKQNMGPIMKSVRKEPSPNLRQFATPKNIGETPLMDVITTRETTTQANVKWHRFKSPVLNFYQDFTTFFNDHVEFTLNDINEKIMRYRELFYRTSFWYFSRYVYICDDKQGEGLVEAPVGLPNYNGGAPVKDDNWLINMCERVGEQGTFDVTNAGRLAGIMSDDLNLPPWEGSEVASQDKPATGKYVVAIGKNNYRNWTFDPYVLKNRPIQMNIVSDKFKGSPFDDLVCQYDPMPMRFNLATPSDSDAPTITWPEPETIEMAPTAPNFQETVPNPRYTRGAGTATAQFEIPFIAGLVGYRGLRVGPPPGPWMKKYDPDKLRAMNWNGEVRMSDRVLEFDANGNVVDCNQFSHDLQLIAEATFGCLPVEFRSVIPIISRRSKGPFSTQPVYVQTSNAV